MSSPLIWRHHQRRNRLAFSLANSEIVSTPDVILWFKHVTPPIDSIVSTLMITTEVHSQSPRNVDLQLMGELFSQAASDFSLRKQHGLRTANLSYVSQISMF
jgi:hypothetical protein